MSDGTPRGIPGDGSTPESSAESAESHRAIIPRKALSTRLGAVTEIPHYISALRASIRKLAFSFQLVLTPVIIVQFDLGSSLFAQQMPQIIRSAFFERS